MSSSPGGDGGDGMTKSMSSNALNQDEKDVVDTLVVPPRGRCLTANCEAVANRGYDNARGEYILFVNDVIGKVGWNRYQVLDILGHGTFGQVAKCKRVARASDASGGTRRFWRASKKRGASVEDLSAIDSAGAGGAVSTAAAAAALVDDNNAAALGDPRMMLTEEIDMDDPNAPQEFAVKVVKNRPAYLNQGFVEIQILELLNQQIDPNDEHRLVRLVDYFTFRQHLILVFELLSMNLYELVKQNQFRGLSLRLTRLFIGQLLKALAALARAKIIHCFPEHDHQLLTNRGFLFLDEVEALVDIDRRTGTVRDWRGLTVANYDAASRRLVYTQPRRLVVNASPTEHVEFSDRAEAKRWLKPAHASATTDATGAFKQRLSIVTTSEHRLYVADDDAKNAATPAYRKVLAHALASHAQRVPAQSVQFLSLASGGVKDASGERTLAAVAASLALTVDQVDAFLEVCGVWLATGSSTACWAHFFGALGDATDAASRTERLQWIWQLEKAHVRLVVAGIHCALDGQRSRLDESASVVVDSVAFRDRLIVLLTHGGYAATFDGVTGAADRWRIAFADEGVAAAATPSVSASRDVVRTHKERTGRTWCFDMNDGLVVVRRAHRLANSARTVVQASQATIQSNCDLKPENILLENLVSPNIKLIDFGSACFEGQTVYSYIQSRFYRSPEVLLGVPYNRAIDLWSLGCISAELFLGLPLLPGSSEYDQMRRIVDMRGLPPPRLLRRGKSTHKLFVRTAPNFDYRLKTAMEYTASTGIELAPPKRYLKHDTLHDLVTKYPMKRALSTDDIAAEEQQRVAFLHFLQGLLNVDPVRRWTATQAAQHPFVLNEPLPEGGWKPAAPPATKKDDEGGEASATSGMTAAEAAAHVLAKATTTRGVATSATTSTAAAGVPTTAAAPATAASTTAASTCAQATAEPTKPRVAEPVAAPAPAATATASTAVAAAPASAAAQTQPAAVAATGEPHSIGDAVKRERALTSQVALPRPAEGSALRPHDTDSTRPKDSTQQRTAPIAMPGNADAGAHALAQSFAAPFMPHPHGGWMPQGGPVAPGGMAGSGGVHYPPVASSYPPVAPLTPWSATFGMPQLPFGQLPVSPLSQQQQLQQQQQLLQQAQQAQAHMQQSQPQAQQLQAQLLHSQPQAIGRAPTLFAPFTHYNNAFVLGSPPTMTSQPRSYQASYLGAPLGTTPWAVGSSGNRGLASSGGNNLTSSAGAVIPPAGQSSLLTPNATPGTTPRSTPRTPRSMRANASPNKAASQARAAALTSSVSSSGRTRADSNTSGNDMPASTGELVFAMDDDEGGNTNQSPRRQRSDTGGTNTSSLSSRSSAVDGSLDDVEFFEHLQIGKVDVGTQGAMRQATPPSEQQQQQQQ